MIDKLGQKQTEKSESYQSTLLSIFIISSIILFLCSSLRHFLLQSNAYDLGIFDQAIYLISQGKEPITTVQGFHIMGDHAAWIHYILAIPYIIYPNVHWLFLIQSVALVSGIIPLYHLSIHSQLKHSTAITICISYLLYPVIFNANLFDFHPEVISVPLLLTTILASRINTLVLFCTSIILILGCKAVLSLTIIFLGLWLIIWEKRHLYGLIATISGLIWFIISTQIIIPSFSGEEAAAVGRYSYLGDSVFEIIKNLILQPHLILGNIFSLDNLFYLFLLFIPLIWGLSFASLQSLIPAIPCLALNLLSTSLAQKDLVHQYSLPALPFLMLAVITSLSKGKGFIQDQKSIIIWSVITFIALSKFTYFGGKYLEYTDNLGATKEAISLVSERGGVYTTSDITPHLTHRELIEFTDKGKTPEQIEKFDYILLNIRHPGWASDKLFAQSIFHEVKNNPKFKQRYTKDDVYLFEKIST